MARRQIAAATLALALSAPLAHAQEIDVVMALPAPTLTFSSAFIAEDAGFYKQAGLKVTHRNLVGVASVNAVIAGSADFTIGTGPVFLRAAAQGQRGRKRERERSRGNLAEPFSHMNPPIYRCSNFL